MGFSKWVNKGVRKMDYLDFSLTKAAVFLFTLLIVKFWPALTALDWYWYLALAVIAAIRPMSKFLDK